MFPHKIVVLQMRIGGADAIDFVGLAGRKIFVGIEAPAAFEQTLAAQNFVDAGDAAMKMMRWIEERGVGIGDLLGEREHC